MGTDSDDVGAQEDQDISAHLERGGRARGKGNLRHAWRGGNLIL